MGIAERILYSLAQRLSPTEVAQTSDMKASIRSPEAYVHYRASVAKQHLLEAAGRYGVSVRGRRVLDFGCSDGATTATYLEQGAAHVVGVDIDASAVARARSRYTDPGSRSRPAPYPPFRCLIRQWTWS